MKTILLLISVLLFQNTFALKDSIIRDNTKVDSVLYFNYKKFNSSYLVGFKNNPALAGLENINTADISYSYQPLNNTSANLGYDFRLRQCRNEGIGFNFNYQKQLGLQIFDLTVFSYSRHFYLKRNKVISIGGSLEYVFLKLDPMGFTGNEGDVLSGYIYAYQGPGKNNSNFIKNTFGINYKTPKFNCGLFATNIPRTNESVVNGYNWVGPKFGANISRYFTVKSKLIIQPELFANYYIAANKYYAVGLVRVILNKNYMVAVGVTSSKYIYNETGVILKNFEVTASSNYFFENNGLNKFSINLRYNLK